MNEFAVWMDNVNTICCGDGLYFGSLDLRANKSKWKGLQEFPRMDVSGIVVV